MQSCCQIDLVYIILLNASPFSLILFIMSVVLMQVTRHTLCHSSSAPPHRAGRALSVSPWVSHQQGLASHEDLAIPSRICTSLRVSSRHQSSLGACDRRSNSSHARASSVLPGPWQRPPLRLRTVAPGLQQGWHQLPWCHQSPQLSSMLLQSSHSCSVSS